MSISESSHIWSVQHTAVSFTVSLVIIKNKSMYSVQLSPQGWGADKDQSLIKIAHGSG